MRWCSGGAGRGAWGVRGEGLGQGYGAGGRGGAVLSRRSWKEECGNRPIQWRRMVFSSGIFTVFKQPPKL